MAFRKFGDIEYPVPGTDTAIEVLRPGARYQLVGTQFTRWEDPEKREPPTWSELLEEIHREKEVYDYYEWERNRQQEYPDLKDQLDMLYHDIKSGKINNGDWINTIELIKSRNPKPNNQAP